MIKRNKNFLLGTLVAITLAACSGEDNGAGSAASGSNNGYNAEDTKTAIEQCTQSGASQAMCECATKEIQARISAEEMKVIEADMLAGKAVTEEFAKASAEAGIKCMQAQG